MPLLPTLLLAMAAAADPFPVQPIQSDPHQIALALRDRRFKLPESDCQLLDLGECNPSETGISPDIIERWVQLDDDPELEVILLADIGWRFSYAAYIFDHGKTWNLAGSFIWRKHRGKIDSLLSVLDPDLTANSPRFLISQRDLGGSDTSIQNITLYQMRQGKLWPVLEFHLYTINTVSPERESRIQVFIDRQNHSLVFETTKTEQGKSTTYHCAVQRWDSTQLTFLPVPAERTRYCNPQTGRIPTESYPSILPTPPPL